ncbi:MAG: hypothetical protein P4M08_05065 [Oligoflexia bacterium]|nr:hypothetical protein [Oligoflexia bacterium]
MLTLYSRALQVLGVLYLLAGLSFVFYSSEWLSIVNAGSHLLHFGDPLPEASDRLWNIIGGSQCATLAALSFLSAESPKVRGYILTHLLAKVTSAAGFLYFFLNFQHSFVYVLGGGIECLIFLFLVWRLLRAKLVKQRSQDAPTP